MRDASSGEQRAYRSERYQKALLEELARLTGVRSP
jgi:hypothetical protein